jgi:hypothetical protein
MTNRWMAVVLGAAVLAIPGTAVAKGDHGKGLAKKEKAEHHKSHEHGEKGQHGRKDKAGKKAKKPKNFVFRGVYKGDGVVTVSSGNSWVRKGGYVGKDVTFDLSEAKLKVADTDGVAGVSAADVQVGDTVLVQARLPRGTKAPEPVEPAPAESGDDAPAASGDDAPAEEAPAAIKARKLIDFTHPPVSDDAEAEPAEPSEAPAS